MKWTLAIIIACAVLVGCANPVIERIIEKPVQVAPTDDTRLALIPDAVSAEWIAYPGGSVARKINDKPEVREKCNKPKHSYIFFDDEAVIGYEPPADDLDGSVMARAVGITVELHNRDNPDAPWDYIAVGLPPPPPPVTSNDQVLGKWKVALCLDDGTIVGGPYEAANAEIWNMFKSSVIAGELERYNRDHDPDAHIVWGTDE